MRAHAQLLPLWIPEPTIAPGPDLRTYHRIVVNSSAGKDSQAALDVTVEQARAAGVLDRLVVAHADLSDNEWPGVPELAAEHAAHYGLRFEIVARRKADGTVDTILDRVAQRGLWPDAKRRWCTSDHKRGPRYTLFTRLVAELRESGAVTDGPVRILSVMGMRAEESCERTNTRRFGTNAAPATGCSRPGAQSGRCGTSRRWGSNRRPRSTPGADHESSAPSTPTGGSSLRSSAADLHERLDEPEAKGDLSLLNTFVQLFRINSCHRIQPGGSFAPTRVVCPLCTIFARNEKTS